MHRPTSKENLLSRARVTPEGCWEWLGYRNRKGYGQVSYQNQRYGAHRVAYLLWRGDVPEQLHHACGFKACINPEHLVAIDPAEHTRIHHTNGDFCVNGHLWKDNTYIRKDGGGRQCRRCCADREKVRRAANRARFTRETHMRRIRGSATIDCPQCGLPVRGERGLRVHRTKAGH